MVVLIASVCRPVIWSVTATAVMLPEVAVMVPSSPNQISSIFLLDHPRLPGIVQEDRELEQHGINAVRIVDQKARQFGFSLNEFIDELLHQLRIEFHSGRGFAEKRFQLRVVLIAGLPGVGGPIAHERFVRSMDRPRRSLRASQFVIEGVCEGHGGSGASGSPSIRPSPVRCRVPLTRRRRPPGYSCPPALPHLGGGRP